MKRYIITMMILLCIIIAGCSNENMDKEETSCENASESTENITTESQTKDTVGNNKKINAKRIPEDVTDLSDKFKNVEIERILFDQNIAIYLQGEQFFIAPFTLTDGILFEQQIKIQWSMFNDITINDNILQIVGNGPEGVSCITLYNLESHQMIMEKEVDIKSKYDYIVSNANDGEVYLYNEDKNEIEIYNTKSEEYSNPINLSMENIAQISYLAKGEKGYAFAGAAYKEEGSQSNRCYGFISETGSIIEIHYMEADAAIYNSGIAVYESELDWTGKNTIYFLDADQMTIGEVHVETDEEAKNVINISYNGSYLLTYYNNIDSLENQNTDESSYCYNVYDVAKDKKIKEFHFEYKEFVILHYLKNISETGKHLCIEAINEEGTLQEQYLCTFGE